MSSGIAILSIAFLGVIIWLERGRWLLAARALLHRRSWFRLPAIKPLPDSLELREYQTQDREACLRIYRDNEAKLFPPGFLVAFEAFLDREDYLKLVICAQTVPVAIGGIQLHPYLNRHCAWLVFGMVAPDWQHRGLGAAMLTSRLALIEEPTSSTRLFMTNVAKTRSYFERFGFGSQGIIGYGTKLTCSSALLDTSAWLDCRARVQALGLTLPVLSVPKINFSAAVRASKPDPLARGRTGFSKLDEAVLLQLCGLLSLLMVPHRSVVLGWGWVLLSISLIVGGGVVYRRELRRKRSRKSVTARQ